MCAIFPNNNAIFFSFPLFWHPGNVFITPDSNCGCCRRRRKLPPPPSSHKYSVQKRKEKGVCIISPARSGKRKDARGRAPGNFRLLPLRPFFTFVVLFFPAREREKGKGNVQIYSHKPLLYHKICQGLKQFQDMFEHFLINKIS